MLEFQVFSFYSVNSDKMHLCAGGGLTKKRSFILSSCHQVLSLGGVRADDNTADEERSSEINGEGCAHLSIHSSFFKKTSIHVILDVRMAKEKKILLSSRSGFYRSSFIRETFFFLCLNIWRNYLCEVQTRVWLILYCMYRKHSQKSFRLQGCKAMTLVHFM